MGVERGSGGCWAGLDETHYWGSEATGPLNLVLVPLGVGAWFGGLLF